MSVPTNPTFTGTQNADTITPGFVSNGVSISNPAFPTPSNANDSISGLLGKDTLDGGGGNDTILGGDNEDSILGSDGNDSLKGEESKDTVSGGDGNDTVIGGNGEDLLYGDVGNDSIDAGDSQDTVYGGNGDDTIDGGDNGDNSLFGGGGDDEIEGGKQQDVIAGGAGDDSIDSDQGTDTVWGGEGNDTIEGDQAGDRISGGKGEDSIDAGNDDDIVFWNLGDGNDTIDLGGNNDSLALYDWTGPDTLEKFQDFAERLYGNWLVSGKQEDLTFTYKGGTADEAILKVKFNTNQDKVVKYQDFICFYPGTLIRTPRGEVPVETLNAGDLVLTAESQARPVRFLFRQTVSTRFADPMRALPIRIRAGALGENLPVRDLLVSPAHALLVDGVLVQAGALVNGTSILREADVPEVFTYWHVEMADHSLVLAEGVPAETFVDSSERENFDNWAEYQALVADAAPVPEMPLPRAKSHRQVPGHVRALVAARAAAIRPAAAAA